MAEDLRSHYRYIPEFISEEEEEYLLRKIAETPQPKWKNVTKRRLQVWGGEIGPSGALLAQPLPPFLNSYPNLIERLASTEAFVDSPHKAPNHVIINEYKPGEGIMPHEDGPSYYPVVATISLGSHAVFHYLQYKDKDPNASINSENASAATSNPPVSTNEPILDEMKSKGGRAIDPNPVLTLLLERRSVIITTGALYRDHLHCIREVEEDQICGAEEDSSGVEETAVGDGKIRIDNWEDITGEEERKVVREGGVLQRGTRLSLTCRDVKKVRKGLLGVGNGRKYNS